jgi:glycosyltransferase involved in cell wall biosynthesis
VRVSVVIPTYNRAEFVRGAIASVLRQDCPDIELIVVDDGSRDGTAAVVSGFGSAVHYLWQENHGVSAARNRGVAASTGDLIAFLDSDDLWLPRKVSAQVAYFAAHANAQACHTDEIWIRRGVRVNERRIHRKHGGWQFLASLPRCLISPSAIMMRRALWDRLGGFDESLPACEDYDLWLRLTAVAPVGFLPERFVVKRGGHADQLSRRTPMLDRYRIKALEKVLAMPLPAEHRQAVLGHLAAKCRIVAQGARKRQRTDRWACYHAKEQQYRQRLSAERNQI